jgi:hypothetical protein
MRMQSLVMSATAAIALTIGLGSAVPAASATVTHAAGADHALSVPTTDISNFWTYTGTSESDDGFHGSCIQGREYGWAGNDPVNSVVNNCEYRIYMQQDANGVGGWSFCINPHSTRNVIGNQYQLPASIKVGNSTASC